MATGFVNPVDYTVDAFPTGAGFTAMTDTTNALLNVKDRSGTPTFRFDAGLDSNSRPLGFEFTPVGTADDVEFYFKFRQTGESQDTVRPVMFRTEYVSSSDWTLYLAGVRVVGSGSTVSDWRQAGLTFVAAAFGGQAWSRDSTSSRVWDVDVDYEMRLRLTWTGTTNEFRAKYWVAGDLEPDVWTVTGSDSQIAPGGFHGFGLRKNATGSYYDLDFIGWATGGDTAPTSGSTSSLDVPAGFTFAAAASSRQLDGSFSSVTDAATYDWQVEVDVAGVWTPFDLGSTASLSFQLTDADGVDWATAYRARVRAVPTSGSASAYTSWAQATVVSQPVNEWYVAGTSAWTAADLVALS